MNSIKDYVLSLFGEDLDIELATKEMEKHNMPIISISPVYGRLLTLLTRLTNARQVLEVGCLGGIGSMYLARGVQKSGRVISLEKNKNYAKVAQTNLERYGYAEFVDIQIGEALDLMHNLEQLDQRFDVVFIDADKAAYPAYLEQALKLTNPNALILADNTLSRGRVIDESDQSPGVKGIREFNQMVSVDSRLEATLLPGVDGLTVARVRDIGE